MPLVPSANREEIAPPLAAAVTELPRLDGMTVLGVDDDPDSWTLVGVALGQCGAMSSKRRRLRRR